MYGKNGRAFFSWTGAGRSFLEERRRTKVIPRLMDEKSAMKLVFATLIRVSEEWSRGSVSELGHQRLKLLRRQLGMGGEAREGERRSVKLGRYFYRGLRT